VAKIVAEIIEKESMMKTNKAWVVVAVIYYLTAVLNGASACFKIHSDTPADALWATLIAGGFLIAGIWATTKAKKK